MASIFTYDPDPPRVASPWMNSESADLLIQQDPRRTPRTAVSSNLDHGLLSATSTGLGATRITHLEAEPQDGPVEYKLHLLLRPRRAFTYRSTNGQIPGSNHSASTDDRVRRNSSRAVAPAAGLDSTSDVLASPSTSTYQSRQHRLQQLTTQLLWRLQQSSPHHTSSATNTILPSLPEPLPELAAPQSPAKLLHGLEESRGALYEIGVADDGTLVGLAEDELQESLNNLRAMAACLGCVIEPLRREVVGVCEWTESVVINDEEQTTRHRGELVVMEVLVKPCLHPTDSAHLTSNNSQRRTPVIDSATNSRLEGSPAEQLRITLTGPTMSGKSSLLGTLTTSTLDNGRGKSRISMLKHRHEINSGITSSVTQELIGYAEDGNGDAAVINYAAENIASWIDMHIATSSGRVVFISDSAGHPRYRRTTIRGLVGWAPHWTLLCIPADDTDVAMGKNGRAYTIQQPQLAPPVIDMDLSGAQLELCLRLQLPLVLIITKLDLASKAGLKTTLTKLLDTLKAAGRKPAILANPAGLVEESDLQTVRSSVIDQVYKVVLPLLNDPLAYVPIVLTSAVQGTGIANLQALLHELPIPDVPAPSSADATFVFHIEDIYSRPAEEASIIVSGRVRAGKVSVEDTGVIGPFSTHELEDSEDSDERSLRRPSLRLPTSRSFPGALPKTIMSPRFPLPTQEWRRYKVLSIRNLRLPVHSLLADQIGTIAITPYNTESSTAGFGSIRKGMVLTAVQPVATRTFVAHFKREDLESLAVGNHVVVYIASVRASAKVVSASAPDSPVAVSFSSSPTNANRNGSEPGDGFSFDDMENALHETAAGMITAPNLLVTFSFDAAKEFVMIDDTVLVMPGGGPGLYGGHERGEKGVAGLEGFVGRVTQTYE